MKFKLSLTISLLLLIITAASLSGATAAWFTSQDDGETTFTAGTVEISEPQLVSDYSLECLPPSGREKTLTWEITNTGSKRARFRVKLTKECSGNGGENETAWGVAQDGVAFGDGKNNFAKYFSYEKGIGTESTPKSIVLAQGRNMVPVGNIVTWDNGDTLFVKVETYDNVLLTDTHLYAGINPPTDSSPGQLGWQQTPTDSHEYTYQLDYIRNTQGDAATIDVSNISNGQTIYIAVHAVVNFISGSVTYTFSDSTYNWVQGSDGYWYYDSVVSSGEAVTVTVTFTLPEDYKSGDCSVYLEAEAVQASHNAIDYIWPDNPF